MPESSEGRYDFYIRIAEMCDTARRHNRDFAQEYVNEVGGFHGAALLSYHLRQAENKARELAGQRPVEKADSPSPAVKP